VPKYTRSAQCKDAGRAKEIGRAVNAACQGNLSRVILGTRAIGSAALLYTYPVYTLFLPDKQTGDAWELSKYKVPSEMGERWVAKCCNFRGL
jgi:hypothetical protein